MHDEGEPHIANPRVTECIIAELHDNLILREWLWGLVQGERHAAYLALWAVHIEHLVKGPGVGGRGIAIHPHGVKLSITPTLCTDSSLSMDLTLL